MNFGDALAALKEGRKVARTGWNGKGMFIIFVPGTPDAKLRDGTQYKTALGRESVTIQGHLDMFTASQEMQPGWLASQSDMLADDWCIVE